MIHIITLFVGILRDLNGNFIASYHLIGVVALLSGVLFLCGPLFKKCKTDGACSSNEDRLKTQTT